MSDGRFRHINDKEENVMNMYHNELCCYSNPNYVVE